MQYPHSKTTSQKSNIAGIPGSLWSMETSDRLPCVEKGIWTRMLTQHKEKKVNVIVAI